MTCLISQYWVVLNQYYLALLIYVVSLMAMGYRHIAIKLRRMNTPKIERVAQHSGILYAMQIPAKKSRFLYVGIDFFPYSYCAKASFEKESTVALK